ncbi:hypothetical protein [Streptomyces rubellomurinus]|uniref:Uncharacterized protein n=1 Tax=Streptomyces rubellomurinus (strain ATCC 31215) TaxID=359131 RepID=A0A0F2TEE0_STRR3|nr:hypothetical protein [Streptomyces rubellomurinus]KJS60670.1 hypothetical protein VM95_19855 [Streptomyces rubellomurinus]
MASPTARGRTHASSQIRITGSPEVAAAALAALRTAPGLHVVRVSRPVDGDTPGEVRQYVRLRPASARQTTD